MLRQPEAYLMWLVGFCLQGAGIFMTTNMGSICKARQDGVSAANAVMAFSSAQSLSRLLSGRLSHMFVQRGLTRAWSYCVAAAIMSAGQAALCVPGPVALCIGVALSGFAFGSTYPLHVLVVGDLFG